MLWGWWLAIVSLSVLWQTQLISPSTVVLGTIFLLFLLPVLWMEVRRQALSSFLEHIFASRGKTFIFLFLLLLFVVKFYWIPGYRLYTMNDGPPHFLNTWMVYHAIRSGEIPFWTNYWACGAPFLQFYPPLFFYLSAAILLLHENIFFVIRFVLTTLHLLSGFTLYLTVRSLGAHRKAAFVSAIVYAIAPWHVFQLFHFNRFPVAPVYTLLPLLFLSTEMLRRNRLAGALLGGVGFAGIAISHQGYAIFSGILFGLYTFIRSFCRDKTAPRPQSAYLLHILVVGLLGIGMASFLIFPYLLESKLLPYLPSVGRAKEIKGYIMDNPYLATLFLWSRQPVGHCGYVGISLFVSGVLGLMGWSIQRGRGWAALLGCCAFSCYLVLGHHNSLYSLIPFVYSQFYAGRYLIFLVLFLSIGSGLFIPCLEQWIRNRRPTRRPSSSFLAFCEPRLTLILLAIFIADLGPISHYRRVSPRHSVPDQEAIYARIEQERRVSSHRIARAVDIPKEFRLRKHGSLIIPFEAQCPTPVAGQFGTLRSFVYISKTLKNAYHTLPLENGFPESFLQAMYLLNVRYVCTDILSETEARKLGGENFGGTLWLFTLSHVSPVVASARIEDLGERLKPPTKENFLLDRWNPPDLPERIIHAMELDRKNMRAGKILVRDGPAHPVQYQEPVGPIRVDQEELRMSSMRLAITAGSDCYLRISQSHYPYQQILLDGEPVEDVYRSAMDFIVIPFPKGQHTVEINAVLSPLRKTFRGISFCVLLLTLCLSVAALRQRKEV